MKKDRLREFAAAGIRARVAVIEREIAEYYAECPDLFIGKTAPQLLKASPRPDGASAFPAVVATKADAPPPRKSTAWTKARRAQHARTMRQLAKERAASRVYVPTGLTARVLAVVRKRGTSRQSAIVAHAGGTTSGVSSSLARLIKYGLLVRTDDGYSLLVGGAPATGKKKSAARTNGTGAPGPKGWKAKWYAQLQAAGGPVRLKDSAIALKTESSNLLSGAVGWLRTGVIQKTGPGMYAIGETAPTP